MFSRGLCSFMYSYYATRLGGGLHGELSHKVGLVVFVVVWWLIQPCAVLCKAQRNSYSAMRLGSLI